MQSPSEVCVLGIAGGSGAGKTTLTRCLVARITSLGWPEVSVLAFDSYYRDLSYLPIAERRLRNFDHPDALDHELFINHIDALKAGMDVGVPVYDFATHTWTGRFQLVKASPVVVVEGILLLAFSEIAQRLDFSLFLDVAEDIRLQRRILRDTAERGRKSEDVRRQFAATVAPMHNRYVQPFRDRADRMASGDVPYSVLVDELLEELKARIPNIA